MSLRLHSAVEYAAGPPGLDRPPLHHADIVDRLLERAAEPEPAAGPGPDLVVLVYAAPDTQGHKTTASHLNLRTGGAAHSFALTVQGTGGPFAALRVAEACARTGRGSSSVLALVECAGAEGVSAASGVLLRLDGQPGYGVAETRSVPLDRLADACAALVPEKGRLLLVLGPGTDPEAAPAQRTDVRTPPPDSSCTAVWRLLARESEAWREQYPVVALCAADPDTRTGHLAVLRDLDQ
ncbi:hypothetical protein [Streptomyces sp. Ru72]|uniref:hypothetical protein n=1 Tax=Streptomyces sp. Ru72 TaxID=2080747 RepID=UPI000CDD3C45|nr:hypothetical protein [Streptomyces sp. Ru72]POX46504.1 hypothetical protein C3488_26200 [Streptomyces sp. Ru72]